MTKKIRKENRWIDGSMQPRGNQHEIDHHNWQIPNAVIEFVSQNLPAKKARAQKSLLWGSFRVKAEVPKFYSNPFSKLKREDWKPTLWDPLGWEGHMAKPSRHLSAVQEQEATYLEQGCIRLILVWKEQVKFSYKLVQIQLSCFSPELGTDEEALPLT